MKKMRLILYVEHHEGRLDRNTPGLVSAGLKLARDSGIEAACVLLGLSAEDGRAAADALAGMGVREVLLAPDSRLRGYAPETKADVLVDLYRAAERRAAFIFTDDGEGGEIAARIAAELRIGYAPRCIDLGIDLETDGGGPLRAVSLGYDGKAQIATCGVSIAALSPGAFEEPAPPPRAPGGGAAIHEFHPDPGATPLVEVTGHVPADPRTVPLGRARLIVGGGGGLDDFGPLWELGDLLGAAIGGTRIASDRGNLPRERFIGETGQTVSPRAYVAFGISGANQHVRGLRDVDVVIAVNTDRYAPLMKTANMAVVGDAPAVIRALLARLRPKT